MNISQSSYVVAAILLGFIVFITIRGELPGYVAAVIGEGAAATTATPATTPATQPAATK